MARVNYSGLGSAFYKAEELTAGDVVMNEDGGVAIVVCITKEDCSKKFNRFISLARGTVVWDDDAFYRPLTKDETVTLWNEKD